MTIPKFKGDLHVIKKMRLGCEWYYWQLHSPDGTTTRSGDFDSKPAALRNVVDILGADLLNEHRIAIHADEIAKRLILSACRVRHRVGNE